MTHYADAKAMMNIYEVNDFIRTSLQKVFEEGYSFTDDRFSEHPKSKPSVVINIKGMDNEKSKLFDAVMRIMNIEISYPCGPSRQVSARFPEEIKEFKKILIKASGIEPIEDNNFSINRRAFFQQNACLR